MRALLCALVACLVAPSALALPFVGLPPQGPDAPTLGTLVAVLAPFPDEVFSFEERWHTALIQVPVGWNRVVLEFTGTPAGDPWDRLFGVSLGGLEVLRGTTPRAAFTVHKELTEYASLLPAGGSAEVGIILSTYVGAQRATVRLAFYDDPLAPAIARADAAVGALRWTHLGADGDRRGAAVAFPAQAPSSAVVELAITGHGSEEFWFLAPGPRVFHILVDGREVASVLALPYTYAFVGIAGANGQQNAQTLLLHQAMWWTAQQGLDLAGVHGGVGEIPPYRAEVRAGDLPLLAGARTVEVVQDGGAGVWVTSLNVLLG